MVAPFRAVEVWSVWREVLLLSCLADLVALTAPMVDARTRQLQEDPTACNGEWSTCTEACEMAPGNSFGYAARVCIEQPDAPVRFAADCTMGIDDCECPPGNYYAITCEACPPGKYDHDQDPRTTRCVDCPEGKFSPGGRVLSCELCEAGKYAAGAGTGACADCPPGEHAGQGARRCAPTYSTIDATFTQASHNFLCADDDNSRGVLVAQKFTIDERAARFAVIMPTGYRLGCEGDENSTSAAALQCANEIVCEFPPLSAGSQIPETGLDCVWSGARCSEGFEGTFAFGCGMANLTAAEVMGEVPIREPDLTPLGCTEIPPEPEPEDPTLSYVYCDPREYPPGRPVQQVVEPKPGAEEEEQEEEVVVGPCPGGLLCPDCCALAERENSWILDRSAGHQEECYDANDRDPWAATNDRAIEFIQGTYGRGEYATYRSPFACVCPPEPPPVVVPGVPWWFFVLVFCCCTCFYQIFRKIYLIQKRHTARREEARCVSVLDSWHGEAVEPRTRYSARIPRPTFLAHANGGLHDWFA